MKLWIVLLSLSVCFLASTAHLGIKKSFGDVFKYLGDLSNVNIKAHTHRVRYDSKTALPSEVCVY